MHTEKIMRYVQEKPHNMSEKYKVNKILRKGY